MISTKILKSDLFAAGCSIAIYFSIEIDHAVAGENLFRIQVRQKGLSIKQ